MDDKGNLIVRVVGPVTAYAAAKANGYTGTEQEWAEDTANAAINAQTARTAKETAVEAAKKSADAKETSGAYSTVSRSWAIGGTGARPGEDADNAKYYAGLAAQSAAKSGYIYFSLGEDGHVYETYTEDLRDDLSFGIFNGRMVLTYGDQNT